MERKIGETFEFEGKKLKVVEAERNLCFDCYFYDGVDCQKTDREYGSCKQGERADYKPVIFVEVKDEQPQEQTEQPQKLNLCEILKYCPQGETFWSPMFDNVTLVDIDQEAKNIKVLTKSRYSWNINNDGTITIDKVTSPEIMLYPSRKQRDWSKFTAPWYNKDESIKPKFKVGDIIRHKETNKNDVYKISKVYNDSYGIADFNWEIYMKYQDQYELVTNKFDPKTLKPFDKVLERNNNYQVWTARLFSHICEESLYKYDCNGKFKYCIPYNDDTKHLVGTKEEAPDFYKYWEN